MTPSPGHAAEPAPSAGSDACLPLALLGEELMIYQVAEFRAQIDARMRDFDGAATAGTACIDCTRLLELDGAGLQLLLVTARHLESLGLSLTLVGLNDKLCGQLRGLDSGGLLQLRVREAA